MTRIRTGRSLAVALGLALIRKRVARHVDGCELCAERRRTMASPLSLLAGVPLVPAPAGLRDRVLASVELTGGHGGRGGGPDRDRRGGWSPW